MSGTKTGAAKAAQTIKLRYGADYYATIGKSGGHKSRGGGFGISTEFARAAGSKGGKTSRSLPKSATECNHGHPRTEANTYVDPNGNRRCRSCIKEYNAQYHAKQKELVQAQVTSPLPAQTVEIKKKRFIFFETI